MNTAESGMTRRQRADAELEAFGYPVRQMERFLTLTPRGRLEAMQGWTPLFRNLRRTNASG
ncbi:MAG: hypothetical protein ACKVT1_13665 [Dehalococcoidia bacterium]